MSENPGIFEQMTVTDLLTRSPKTRTQSVIIVKGEDTIESVLKTFATHGITSAPVWSEEFKGYNLVHMLDVVAAAFNTYFTNFESLKENFLSKPIMTIANLSKTNQLHLVKSSTSLANVLKAFATVTRQALVIDDSQKGVKKVTEIITQSDILRLLHQDPEGFAWYLKGATAGKLMEPHPLLVNENTLAIEAFHKCSEKKYCGVGIVDENDRLVGNISVSDLKVISKDNFGWLWTPVKVFLKHAHRDNVPIFCFEEEPAEELLKLFVTKHVHRLHVVDVLNKPIGIITATTVIKFVQGRRKEH